jgi:hypothetical protein
MIKNISHKGYLAQVTQVDDELVAQCRLPASKHVVTVSAPNHDELLRRYAATIEDVFFNQSQEHKP